MSKDLGKASRIVAGVTMLPFMLLFAIVFIVGMFNQQWNMMWLSVASIVSMVGFLVSVGLMFLQDYQSNKRSYLGH